MDEQITKRMIKDGFTAEECADAIRRHNTGNYSVKAPPVCTVNWDRESWVRYIAATYRARAAASKSERGA